MEQIVTCLLMFQKITNSKQKALKLWQLNSIMLKNHFKRLVIYEIWKKTGFNGYVYDFSIDYDATDVDDIVDIQNYLMEKITQCK